MFLQSCTCMNLQILITDQINFIVEVYSGETAYSTNWKASCNFSPSLGAFNQNFCIVKT